MPENDSCGRECQKKRASTQLNFVSQFTDNAGKLLDFGAGAGSFVRAALDQGWDTTGIEQSDSARARAKEFHNVELLKEFGQECYDVATMWDVVEHLRDPVRILRVIGEHLTEDGLIFIATGNFENWRRVEEKDRWGLYLFDHQFYFSPSSLKQVLHRAGYRGFRLLNCNRVYPLVHPMQFCRHPLRSVLSWLEWAKARAKWPEHGDINVMIAVGRKDPGL